MNSDTTTAKPRKPRKPAKPRASLWHPDEMPACCWKCKGTQRHVETSREMDVPQRRVRYCVCECGVRFCTVQVLDEAYKPHRA